LDEQVAAVQAKWKPLLGAADIYKRIKAAVITPFLVAEAAKHAGGAGSRSEGR
jgi:hypothetical protein